MWGGTNSRKQGVERASSVVVNGVRHVAATWRGRPVQASAAQVRARSQGAKGSVPSARRERAPHPRHPCLWTGSGASPYQEPKPPQDVSGDDPARPPAHPQHRNYLELPTVVGNECCGPAGALGIGQCAPVAEPPSDQLPPLGECPPCLVRLHFRPASAGSASSISPAFRTAVFIVRLAVARPAVVIVATSCVVVLAVSSLDQRPISGKEEGSLRRRDPCDWDGLWSRPNYGPTA